MSKLETICDIFIQQGKGEQAAAIIQNGTRPDAKMVRGKIKDIYFRALHAGLTNPAIIIFGEVVNLNTENLPSQIGKTTWKKLLLNEERKKTV